MLLLKPAFTVPHTAPNPESCVGETEVWRDFIFPSHTVTCDTANVS